MFQKIIRYCEALSEWTGRIFAHLIWLEMGFCVMEVVLRRIFNAPTMWSHDMVTLFFALHILLLGGYGLLKGSHVSVDIFTSMLPKRVQALLEIITYIVFFFPFLIILLWVGYEDAAQSWLDFERTTVGTPYVKPLMTTGLPLAAFLLLIQGVSEFIKNIYIFSERGKPQ